MIDQPVSQMLIDPAVKSQKLMHGMALARSILKGIPTEIFDKVVAEIAPGDTMFAYRIVPEGTYKRRKRELFLSVEEGGRLQRIGAVFDFATDIFKSRDIARQFLKRPHPMLDGLTPLEVALATQPGADSVINILGRGANGGAV